MIMLLFLQLSCVLLVYLFVYIMLLKCKKNKNLFHKVTVQGNTIEIFENKDESYFDKYLNEVLIFLNK